ncbi:hypothetical protein NXC24_PC00478 (plasmid) [Rhizobium sp. NXC24]|nr:hypothetical protein NXC24_PC00478 [Rhizobium sp. NXC24]
MWRSSPIGQPSSRQLRVDRANPERQDTTMAQAGSFQAGDFLAQLVEDGIRSGD